MGHKSKFTFPVPGRKAKPAPSTTNISGPLSKAQKILGNGEINIDSPTYPSREDTSWQWDAHSASGISISVSESTASYGTSETGHGTYDEENGTAGTSYGHTTWEKESDIIPNQMQSQSGNLGRTLRPQRSAATVGHGATTDSSSYRRRTSTTSTILSHYERSKVPLAISQQTSNSAIAKGPNTKARVILDLDGSASSTIDKKKKPARLDLSMLRPRSSRDHRQPNVGPVLGNDYVMKSPSIFSHISPLESPSSPGGRHGPTKLRKANKQATGVISPPSTASHERLRLVHDAAGLTQLHDHYEKMAFRVTEWPETDDLIADDSFQAAEPSPPLSTSSLTPPASSHTQSTHRVVTPESQHTRGKQLALSSRQGTNSASPWLNMPQDDTSSVSSFQSRTSKTSKGNASLRGSDWQQSSVLSLSESDSDSDGSPFNDPRPQSSKSSHDDISSSIRTSPSPEPGSRASDTRAFTPLNDFLTIPRASHAGHSVRSPSKNTHRTTSSSTSSTLTGQFSYQSSSGSSRMSGISQRTVTATPLGVLSNHVATQPTYAGYGLQEAQAVALNPLASTSEAALSIPASISEDGDDFEQDGIDREDRPMTSSSMPSLQKSDSPADKARLASAESATTPTSPARMMAVTRQEELLLAALRKKRAKMRENTVTEVETETDSAISIEVVEMSSATDYRGNESFQPESHASLSVSEQQHTNPAPLLKPSASGRPTSSTQKHDIIRIKHTLEVPSSQAHMSVAQEREEKAMVSLSKGVSQKTSDSALGLREAEEQKEDAGGRHEQILLYLDRPLNGVNVEDTAEPSPSLSDFMGFDGFQDQEPSQERSGRSRSKYGSLFEGTYFQSKRQTGIRARPDSSPLSPRSSEFQIKLDMPVPTLATQHEHPAEIEEEYDDFEDVIGHVRMEAPNRDEDGDSFGEAGIARPDSPISPPSDNLLVPSPKTTKAKKSLARLSAVGQVSSPTGYGW